MIEIREAKEAIFVVAMEVNKVQNILRFKLLLELLLLTILNNKVIDVFVINAQFGFSAVKASHGPEEVIILKSLLSSQLLPDCFNVNFGFAHKLENSIDALEHHFL